MAVYSPTYKDESWGNENGKVDNYAEEGRFDNAPGVYTDSARDIKSYALSELSADHALERQEYFYRNYQSPQAMLRQIKEAGLSPSIYASGSLGGGSGTSGVSATPRHSSGSAGNLFSSIVGGISQATQLAIGIAKTKAEIENIKSQTSLNNAESGLKEVQEQYQEYINRDKNIETSLMNTVLYAKVGDAQEGQSLYQIAGQCKTYDNFMATIMKEDWADDTKWYAYSETGQKVLRSIYKASHEFNTNIAELDSTKTNAIFTKGLLDALMSEDFAKLSAKEQIAIIQRNTEAANLDAEQSQAWNNMLNKLGNGSGQDTAIILGMLLKTLLGNTSFSASRSHVVR